MGLEKIYIQNYRAFKEDTYLKIKPLTLIFGENNAGKSSLARLLPSIKKSCKKNKSPHPFLPVNVHNNFGSFDFTYNRDSKFKIGMMFGSHEVIYSINYLEKERISFIENIKVHNNNNNLILDLIRNLDNSSNFKNNYFEKINSKEVDNIEFDGLEVSFKTLQDMESDIHKKMLAFTGMSLNYLKNHTFWLGPLRHTPDQVEKLFLTNFGISPNGHEATQILADSLDRRTDLFPFVQKWFRSFFKHDLNIEFFSGLSSDRMFSVVVSPLNNLDLKVPICDCGTGFSQVLPIIVLGAQAILGELGKDPYIVIENPELHLHDSFHDDLGRFFVDIVNSEFNPKLIVETHSENIMLAIQLKIAKNLIDKENVIINWVKKLDNGTSIIEEIVFDENGIPSENWPISTFKTASNQARELFNINFGK